MHVAEDNLDESEIGRRWLSNQHSPPAGFSSIIRDDFVGVLKRVEGHKCKMGICPASSRVWEESRKLLRQNGIIDWFLGIAGEVKQSFLDGGRCGNKRMP